MTRLDLRNNRLAPNAIETRAAIAEYDSGNDSFTLWNTTQNPHVARLVLSAFIGVAPEHKLRVIAPDVGGGFGSKIFIYPEEVACLWAAKKLRRPVKWAADRTEAFLADAHGRDHVTHAELGLDEKGRITQKPVEAMRRPIVNNSLRGDLVYDEPFAGSGATLYNNECPLMD